MLRVLFHIDDKETTFTDDYFGDPLAISSINSRPAITVIPPRTIPTIACVLPRADGLA
jgi:hypothetical protein